MAYLYLFATMGEVIQGFFRGLGRLRLTMVASLLQVVRVVLSYFLIPVWGMYGICVAVASGWVLLVLIEGSYSVRTARALTMEKEKTENKTARRAVLFINRSISSGSGAVKCRTVCERVGEPQRIRVQRGAGDERPILCAVEPVARKRMTEGRHVDAELVRASGPGRETQERQLAVIGEHPHTRAGGETVGRDAALDERAPARAMGASMTLRGGVTRPRARARYSRRSSSECSAAQQLVNVAGLCRDEQARGALCPSG